jgi:hypothetical protein
MKKRIEILLHKARQAWASGALHSDTDFQFVEDLWISYHRDETLSRLQVKRLEEINCSLEKGMYSGFS